MIEAGSIYLLWCDFTNPPKEKFCICVQVSPRPFFLLINSEVNAFIRRQPALLAQQVPISSTEHGFLDHDSWIDCSDLCPIDNAADQLQRNPNRLRGALAAAARDAVADAVNRSRTLSAARKAIILAALD